MNQGYTDSPDWKHNQLQCTNDVACHAPPPPTKKKKKRKQQQKTTHKQYRILVYGYIKKDLV